MGFPIRDITGLPHHPLVFGDELLEAVTIQVNGWGKAMQPYYPFGGFKNSGHGSLGGEEGLHAFLQLKTIRMSLAAPEGGQ